jgi:hypothetical protein
MNDTKWKAVASELLGLMSDYGMMTGKIKNSTHAVATEAIKVIKSITNNVDLSKYEIETFNHIPINNIVRFHDGDIIVNNDFVYLHDLEPYDQIRVAQALCTEAQKLIEKTKN